MPFVPPSRRYKWHGRGSRRKRALSEDRNAEMVLYCRNLAYVFELFKLFIFVLQETDVGIVRPHPVTQHSNGLESRCHAIERRQLQLAAPGRIRHRTATIVHRQTHCVPCLFWIRATPHGGTQFVGDILALATLRRRERRGV